MSIFADLKVVSTLIAAEILFFLSSGAQTPPWKGTITKEGDIAVVRNPKTPIYKDPILTLKEDWVIGGEEAEGEYAIAHPYGLAVDGEGRVYVLELREQRIKVFDQAGKFLRSIGRKGQGPGEIGSTFAIFVIGEANELVVPDTGNRRFSFFSSDGKFLRSVPIHEIGFASGAIDSKGAIYLDDSPLDLYAGRSILKKLSPDGTRLLTEVLNRPQNHSNNPFSPRERWIIDAQDRLIYGDAKTYEIRYFSPDGKLARKIVREYEPLKVTTKDMDEFESRKTPPGIVMPPRKTIKYSTHHAAYRRFFADDQGDLLVQTWERTADNRQDIHDVFDSEGRFLGRVALPRHADLINPKVRIMKNGKFYAIEPDAEGFEVLKKYSVTWNVK
jgi:hypothetical protein